VGQLFKLRPIFNIFNRPLRSPSALLARFSRMALASFLPHPPQFTQDI
jgi:hypothetical protein